MRPRWTVSTHLGPPLVWSALCLLLGKTVKLREEKPDRMEPAILLQYLILFSLEKASKRQRENREREQLREVDGLSSVLKHIKRLSFRSKR